MPDGSWEWAFRRARALLVCTESEVLIRYSRGVAMERLMTAPLSQDLRARIVRAVESGSSIRQAAARYEVSPSAAVKLMRRVHETGSAVPARIGGYRRPLLEAHQDLLRSLVETKPEITLAEIQSELRARGIVVLALSTIHDMLKRMKLTRKKRRPARPSRTVPMSRASADAGGSGSASWTRPASCFSMRPAPRLP
jgi:transposase